MNLDPDQANDAFRAMLARCPESGVGAIGPNGLFVPIPDSISLGRHTVLEARSGVDLVLPEDRLGMARAWGDARTSGVGKAAVHLLDGHYATCHVFDVRALHGVWMMVLVLESADGPGPEGTFAAGPPIVPRVCTMVLDETALIADADDATSGMLGWSREELAGQPTLELIHPDDQVRAIDCWMATITAPDVAQRIRCRYAHKNGTWLWIEVTMQVLTDVRDAGMVHSEMVDISEEMAAHEELRSRERMLRQLTESLPSGVVQVDRTGRIVYKNDRVEQIVGHSEATTLSDQFAASRVDDRPALDQAVRMALGEGRDQDVEVRLEAAGQRRERVCQVLLRPLIDELGITTGAIVSISDVTESTVLRMELQARATFDALTDVHNRASIMALLTSALLRPRPAGSGVAAIFIDLDRFKLVNDQFGHSSGDHLLTVVANRLRNAIRDGDNVGRLGGDEFLIVCPTVDSAANAGELAARVIERLRGPVALRDGSVDLHASVGVAWSMAASIDADGLVAWADHAMYESKREGNSRPVTVDYTATMPGPTTSTGTSPKPLDTLSS